MPDSSLPPDPENVTNGQLYLLIVGLTRQNQADREAAALERTVMTKRVDDLIGEVAMSRRETSEMVDLWKSGKTIIAVVKIAGLIATALLAMWGAVSLAKGSPAVAADVASLLKKP